jgi:hypothetical protein
MRLAGHNAQVGVAGAAAAAGGRNDRCKRLSECRMHLWLCVEAMCQCTCKWQHSSFSIKVPCLLPSLTVPPAAACGAAAAAAESQRASGAAAAERLARQLQLEGQIEQMQVRAVVGSQGCAPLCKWWLSHCEAVQVSCVLPPITVTGDYASLNC